MKTKKSSATATPPPTEPPINEFEEKWKRAVADLENYRRQVENDRVELTKFAGERTLLALLPVFDNFKRASEHRPTELEKNEWAEGVTAIEKQFEQTLADLGLKKIEAPIGTAYDSVRHEPVATAVGETGVILAVIENGYELNGKILRAAKVRIGA